ncbi:pectinesterase inhibitor 7-like [Silene latifolia]|uniref:pectinesterase inhibitor 7-like n=1 Tax=Silene latifolia TaxID=37657 RepID=UPI003D788F72
MEFQLNSLTFPILLFILLLFATASAKTQTDTPSPSPTTNPFDFIRSSCNATLYPDVCFTSLSRYATYVRTDPAQLARIAIGVTLVRARHALSAISNVTRRADYEPDHRVASAVHDCVSVFRDAVDQMRGSLRQMGRLGPGSSGADAVRFQLSNVQTWMSAALTNEDTCTDGFADVEDCPVKNEVCDNVGSVKEFTSNALALVNSFASSVGS